MPMELKWHIVAIQGIQIFRVPAVLQYTNEIHFLLLCMYAFGTDMIVRDEHLSKQSEGGRLGTNNYRDVLGLRSS